MPYKYQNYPYLINKTFDDNHKANWHFREFEHKRIECKVYTVNFKKQTMDLFVAGSSSLTGNHLIYLANFLFKKTGLDNRHLKLSSPQTQMVLRIWKNKKK
jgi:hypothetical protein